MVSAILPVSCHVLSLLSAHEHNICSRSPFDRVHYILGCSPLKKCYCRTLADSVLWRVHYVMRRTVSGSVLGVSHQPAPAVQPLTVYSDSRHHHCRTGKAKKGEAPKTVEAPSHGTVWIARTYPPWQSCVLTTLSEMHTVRTLLLAVAGAPNPRMAAEGCS